MCQTHAHMHAGEKAAGSNQPAAKRLKAALRSSVHPAADGPAAADLIENSSSHTATANLASVSGPAPRVSFMPVGPASRQRMLLDDYRPMCLEVSSCAFYTCHRQTGSASSVRICNWCACTALTAAAREFSVLQVVNWCNNRPFHVPRMHTCRLSTFPELPVVSTRQS